jgi:hypothetical protein
MEGPLWQTGYAIRSNLGAKRFLRKKGIPEDPCGGEITLKHLSSLSCLEAGTDQNESFTPAQPA